MFTSGKKKEKGRKWYISKGVRELSWDDVPSEGKFREFLKQNPLRKMLYKDKAEHSFHELETNIVQGPPPQEPPLQGPLQDTNRLFWMSVIVFFFVIAILGKSCS